MYKLVSEGILTKDEESILKERTMKEAIIEKTLSLIPCGEIITSDILHKRLGNFHVVSVESKFMANDADFSMKRCSWAVYSSLLIDRMYYSTEVTDNKHSYSFAQIVSMFKNYYKHWNKEIQEL